MSDYESYLSHVNQLKNAGNNQSDYYNAGLAAAKAENNQSDYYNAGLVVANAEFLQTVTDDKEYYNSDDENEPLYSSAPQHSYTAPYIASYAAPPYNIAQNNKKLSDNNNRCSHPALKEYTVDKKCSKTVYGYSQNICNLK